MFALRSAPERELQRRYAADREPAIREELVRRFMPMARSLAMRYRRQTESLDDLVQVANLGLVKAIDGFDPDAVGRSAPTRCRPSSASCAATSATTFGTCAFPAGSAS